MPESDHDPGDALVPEAPPGYSDPERFRYLGSAILGIAVLLVPASAAGFGALLWWLQGPAVFESVFEVTETAGGISFALRPATVGVAFVVAVVGTTVVHELCHGAAFALRGYRVSYGLAPAVGAAYAGAFHQFQTPKTRWSSASRRSWCWTWHCSRCWPSRCRWWRSPRSSRWC